MLQIPLTQQLIAGYLLALVRAVAWLFVCPPFGSSRLVPNQVKIGFAGGLAVAMGPAIAKAGVPLDASPLITAAALQAFTGITLGFLGFLMFAALQAAGGLVDMFSGLTMGQMFDPMSGASASVFGRFYNVVAITLLFAIDGHALLVRGFLRSFEAAPMTSLSMNVVARVFTHHLGSFLLAAVEIAAPLLAALFLAEVALGLLGRAAPALNILVLGMPAKILLAILLVGIALPLLPGAVHSIVNDIAGDSVRLVRG